MNAYLKEAQSMQSELSAWRRYLLENAELGFELPKTIDFVTEKLESFGYEVKKIGGGLTCCVGSGSPVLLIRADMDALPITEESGESFACKTGAAHACGHDFHATMLLGAAKILKEHEAELKGTVKFMFQPAEELLKGSLSMIDAGILKNPTVDAAMGFHMNFGPLGDFDLHPGCMSYAPGQMMFSADEFKITVKGRMAHGSSAFQGVSAVNAASLIANTFNSVLALEIPCDEAALLIVGAIQSGNAGNIIPDTATIIGSFRAYTVETREFIRQRVEDITMGIARATRTTATIEYTASVAPVVNNKELAAEMVGYCEEVMDKVQAIPPVKGSEDFANLGLHVPIFFANVCAGDPSDGYAYGMHNPKARISEDALPYGVAAHCNCAVNWLANHSK